MKARIGICCMVLWMGVQTLWAQEYSANKFLVKNPGHVYPGALLNAKSINQTEHHFFDEEVTPITVSSSLPSFGVHTWMPSYEDMMSQVNVWLENNEVKTGNVSFSIAERSYKDMEPFFGQDVDIPSYFGTDEKKKKTCVSAFCSVDYFRLDMDMPENLCPSLVTDNRLEEVLYINSVVFGRRAMVMVESDDEASEVLAAVKEALLGESVSKEASVILANALVRIVVIGEEDWEMKNPSQPFLEVLDYMSQGCKVGNIGGPIQFTAAYLKDHSVFVNEW